METFVVRVGGGACHVAVQVTVNRDWGPLGGPFVPGVF